MKYVAYDELLIHLKRYHILMAIINNNDIVESIMDYVRDNYCRSLFCTDFKDFCYFNVY